MGALPISLRLLRGLFCLGLLGLSLQWSEDSYATPLFDDAKLFARTDRFRGLSSPNHPMRRIVVFGDSLSDTEGRLAAYTGRVMPPAPLYWRSRLSNGPLGVEYIAAAMGVPLVSYATAGARLTQYGNYGFMPAALGHLWAPPLRFQLEAFNQDGGYFDPDDLVVLWIGNNDFMLEPRSARGEDYCASTLEAVAYLRSRGARQLVLLGVADVTVTPFSRRGGSQIPLGELKQLLGAHNQCLKQSLEKVQRQHPDERLDFVDISGIINHVKSHPANYSLNDTQNPCLTGSTFPSITIPLPPIPPLILGHMLGSCRDQNSKMFWDAWHPNTLIHCIASLEVLKQLGQKGRIKGFDEDPASKLCF
jgi:phospholipase/lecithinase/hemolysin